jgi:hypothetical protein
MKTSALITAMLCLTMATPEASLPGWDCIFADEADGPECDLEHLQIRFGGATVDQFIESGRAARCDITCRDAWRRKGPAR